MSLAKFRKVGGKQGAGRFVVSEGIAPSTYLTPHVGLPTLYADVEDDRFEIVIPKGTILTVVQDASGGTRDGAGADGTHPVPGDSKLVPANGTGAAAFYDDAGDPTDWTTTDPLAPVYNGDGDSVVVPVGQTPIGCAQYDLYRPFDKGTSQGGGWIARGYVEWPMVLGVNDDVEPGGLVVSDERGRPVARTTEDWDQVVGRVIEVEYFATNFDDGLLSYMQLPSDPGALRHVYELTKTGPYAGKLGIRANLDVTNVVGAMRVNLAL